MHVEFKFNIGQVVTTVASSVRVDEDEEGNIRGRPMLLNIVERHMSECPGGVQMYYVARGNYASDHFNNSLVHFTRELTKFNEVELMSLEDYELCRKKGDAVP